MKSEPLISIITVVRNGGKILEETILSVINQTYGNIEYIIVDGASTDNTIAIIKKYENRINYWVSEPDRGIYDAMNKGLSFTKGIWINFMNCGDKFANSSVLEDIFSTVYDDKISFLYSDFYMKYNDMDTMGTLHIANYGKGNILHQAILYKKELHEKLGYYIVTNKIIISDYLFFCSVDLNCIQKIDTPISINETNGVSSESWCYRQKICADYIFRRISFCQFIHLLTLHFFKQILKKILGINTSKMLVKKYMEFKRTKRCLIVNEAIT